MRFLSVNRVDFWINLYFGMTFDWEGNIQSDRIQNRSPFNSFRFILLFVTYICFSSADRSYFSIHLYLSILKEIIQSDKFEFQMCFVCLFCRSPGLYSLIWTHMVTLDCRSKSVKSIFHRSIWVSFTPICLLFDEVRLLGNAEQKRI